MLGKLLWEAAQSLLLLLVAVLPLYLNMREPKSVTCSHLGCGKRAHLVSQHQTETVEVVSMEELGPVPYQTIRDYRVHVCSEAHITLVVSEIEKGRRPEQLYQPRSEYSSPLWRAKATRP